jgi:heat shock protein HtpX
VPEEAERDPKARQRLAAVAAGMLPLPNLAVRSAGVLLFLYAMLSAVLLALVEFSYLAPTAALAIGIVVIVAQYVLSPWLMDLCLRWFYQFEWVSADGLPDHLRRFVEGVCKKHGLRLPKFGLIRDSAPNAFTYGHTPNNMRIVVTQGVLELLEPGEVEAVVAHEIGHGKHWDMALMTLAQIVPLLL